MKNKGKRININLHKALYILKPIGTILIYSFLLGGFLFLSSKIILGSSNEETKNINEGDSKNIRQLIIEEGNVESIDKDLNINIETVKVYITKENRIEELPLEEYIKGVVSSEMPVGFELEALKAQAIAARTYAIAHMKPIGSGCANASGGDLCDTTHCHVYTNKDKKITQWGSRGNDNWKKIEEAVNSTANMVITYNNELAKGAYYFSTSGGKTENVEEVFSTKLPYLRSVESKGEEVAPRYRSNVSVEKSDFVSKINGIYSQAGLNINKLKEQIKVISHTEGGSIKELKLGGVVISGKKLRELLGLNSANFTIEVSKNAVEIKCSGFGHGVGMSQWGANAMADEGKTYVDILKHYYTGIEIGKINN